MAESFELPAHDRRVIETGRFTEEERSLLRRHLPAYRRLVEDASLATNERRVRFLGVILRDAEPRTPHEIAFKKFLGEYERLKRDDRGRPGRQSSSPKPRQGAGRRAGLSSGAT
jgi:uncharacterized protein YifE (UPF0438 family)